MSDTRLWWNDPFRMFQTNLREIDADLDVERVLDYLERFGADAWLLSVGGIVSNYPTDLTVQSRNPVLERRSSGDLVGDAVDAAKRRGIRVMGRMDFSKVDHRRAEEHPDWCFVAPSGERQVYNGLASVCPSGPYYQERLFDVLDEVQARYPLDGFFFNWMSFNEVDYSGVYWGVCQCLSCRRGFGDFSPGHEHPTGPDSPGYSQWRRFAAEVLDELTARVRAYVSARRPEAPLILGDRADIVFHEANNAIGRALWHHRTSEHVSAAKTYRPDTPVLTNAVGFVDMPYRLAGEEPHHFAQYLVQAISRGANPSTYIMGTPDVIDYECLDVAGEITRFHRDHTDVYRGLAPAARVVIVRPDSLAMESGRVEEATAEFRGLHSALLERHVPFDVLGASHLGEVAARGGLGRYRVVVLPDLGAVDASIAAALDDFVAAGGALVTTGSSGFDDDRCQLDCMPVSRRLAAYTTVESVRSLHLEHARDANGGPSRAVPVVGAFHVLEPAAGAEVEPRVLSRARYGPPEKCYGHLPLDQFGQVVADYGSGRCAVLPWTVGRAYHQVGLSAHRDLVADLVINTAREPVHVETDLPEQVEVVLGESQHGHVIHLINHSGTAPQRFLAPVPVRGSGLRVPWWPETPARALRAGHTCAPWNTAGGVVTPDIDRFEVVIAESESSTR